MRPRPLELALGLPVAAAAGLVIGTLGTFKARAGAAAGFPYGLVLAVLLVAVFVAALRAGFRTRWFAGAAALGVVAAIGLLLLPGRGGGTVIVLDLTGVLWLVLPTVLAVLAVAVPVPGRRARSGILGADEDEGTRP